MDWKKWSGYNIYKKLWSLVGGRPWTYILRDLWHKFEFLWLVGLIALGVWAGHHYDWTQVTRGLVIFSAGYLMGHLFWGREYIPDQPGE